MFFVDDRTDEDAFKVVNNYTHGYSVLVAKDVKNSIFKIPIPPTFSKLRKFHRALYFQVLKKKLSKFFPRSLLRSAQMPSIFSRTRTMVLNF